MEGKVTGITKFGAFVSLPEGKTGLVHISEIAHSYVNDINEHLKTGQDVKVKVIAIDESGRINLSIKKALPPPEQDRTQRQPRDNRQSGEGKSQDRKFSSPPPQPRAPLTAEENFEERLTRFMQESKSNMASSKLYSEKRNRRRAR